MTFDEDELYDKFLESKKNKSKSTYVNYIYRHKVFRNYVKTSWENINSEDIVYFLNEYYGSNRTKKLVLSAINVFYDWAIYEGYLLKNPIKRYLSNISVDKKERHYLTNEQLEYLLAHCYNYREYFITLFLSRTGLRISEFLNLKLSDINLDEREILVRNSKYNKDRYVFISDELYKHLKIWIRERNYYNPRCDYLMISSRGCKMSYSWISLTYTPYINSIIWKKINFKITPHMLRHTFATMMLNKGVDIKTLSLLLGHEDITTTSIYLHKDKESLKREYLRAMR